MTKSDLVDLTLLMELSWLPSGLGGQEVDCKNDLGGLRQ